MHLVDDIHTHFHLGWSINRVIPQIPDVVYAVVGGGIDFQHVHAGARINGPAGLTAVAGVAIVRVQAVDCLGEDFRAAGLTGAPGTCEQVGVAQAPADNLGFQRLCDRQLARHIVKGLRTVFAV